MTARLLLVRAALALTLALLAPAGVFADCQGTYVVQRGDTLSVIARKFGVTAATLAGLNRIANANLIYAGQVLTLPSGAGCPAASAATHVVQRGETLSRIAARYGVTTSALAAANDIANPSRIYTGQVLVIPGASSATTSASSTLPGLQISPNPPEVGRTVALSIPAAGIAAISGTLGEWKINFFRDGDRFVGLGGIYALADAGRYTLTLSVTDSSGASTAYSQTVAVADGGYAKENLTLSAQKTALLDPQYTVPERERIAAAVAPVTPARYWSGLFQLPAAGRITSNFGTRRSYNNGPYNSYHGGTDFSYTGGLDIVAPAAGVVVLAEPLVVRGNATIIDHGWGVYSGFWHQSEILVKAGDAVSAGQLIGKIGDTGLVTGAHLHWEVFVNAVQVDPLQWTRQTLP